MLMAPLPNDDDLPATRRDLWQLHEVTEAKQSAESAALRADMATARAETADNFAAVRAETAEQFRAVRAEMGERFSKVEERITEVWKAIAGLQRQFTGVQRQIGNQTRLLVTLNVATFAVLAAMISRS